MFLLVLFTAVTSFKLQCPDPPVEKVEWITPCTASKDIGPSCPATLEHIQLFTCLAVKLRNKSLTGSCKAAVLARGEQKRCEADLPWQKACTSDSTTLCSNIQQVNETDPEAPAKLSVLYFNCLYENIASADPNCRVAIDVRAREAQQSQHSTTQASACPPSAHTIDEFWIRFRSGKGKTAKCLSYSNKISGLAMADCDWNNRDLLFLLKKTRAGYTLSPSLFQQLCIGSDGKAGTCESSAYLSLERKDDESILVRDLNGSGCLTDANFTSACSSSWVLDVPVVKYEAETTTTAPTPEPVSVVFKSGKGKKDKKKDKSP